MSAKPVSFLSVHHGHSHSQSGAGGEVRKGGGRVEGRGVEGSCRRRLFDTFSLLNCTGHIQLQTFEQHTGCLFSSDENVEQLHV